VGVNVLQRAGELVVEPLYKGHNAARDAEDLALLNRGQPVIVLPLFGILNHDNLVGVLKDLEELAKLLVGTDVHC
jgi:hypothetical protein